MPRSLWKGTISFGLVTVPVAMQAAVTEQTVRFNQINAKTGARIKQQKIDAQTGEPVDNDDIVKGYELSKDVYLQIDPSEIDAFKPVSDKVLRLTQFVSQAELDPVIFNTSYYFVPEPGGTEAYNLLIQAMAETDKVGIGKLTYAGRERLVALRANAEGIMVGSTLVYADEINASPEVGYTEPDAKSLDMAKMLIDHMTAEFDHSAHPDEYRQQILDLIEAKAAGHTLPTPAEPSAPEPTPDLMASLMASIDSMAKPKAKTKIKETV